MSNLAKSYDSHLKKLYKQALIRLVIAVAGYWLIANVYNSLTGNEGYVSLEKALLFGVALVAILFVWVVIRIAISTFIYVVKSYWQDVKETFKDNSEIK